MNVLVTGGTGTLGTALVKHWLTLDEGRMIVFSRDEEKHWRMKRKFADPRIGFFLGDVRDRDRLSRAMQADIDLVVHAAALKQVDTCEYNPIEAVETNVRGTQNAIQAALDAEISKFVLISSDKAVHPVNLYGMTKGTAEKLTVHANSYSGKRKTRFSAVRYGNVVGSRGSFFDQIKRSGWASEITITDERMTRFWLSIQRAVDFVHYVSDYMQGGEIFVPRPIKARSTSEMAEMAAPRRGRRILGMRPGEKLHETLICREEAPRTHCAAEAYVISPENPSWPYEACPRMQPVDKEFELRSDLAKAMGYELTDQEALELLEAA